MGAVKKGGDEIKIRNCGHEGPDEFKLDIYGEEFEVNLAGKEKEDCNLCPQCHWQRIRVMVETDCARCVLCGKLIIPGSPVSLYHKNNEMKFKKVARRAGDNFIGCLRWECCPSGGFYAGHWSKEGFKPLFKSGMSVAEACFSSGKTIIIKNTDDPSSI